MMTIDAIVLGGGVGKRFVGGESASDLPKQFQLLLKKPVFVHGIESLWNLGCFRNFIITLPEAYLATGRELLKKHFPFYDPSRFQFIPGGARRQDSSSLALAHVEASGTAPTRVLIHDACRPHFSRP